MGEKLDQKIAERRWQRSTKPLAIAEARSYALGRVPVIEERMEAREHLDEHDRQGLHVGRGAGGGAVEDGIEHFWVHAAARRLLGGQPPVIPNRFGRRFPILRQPFVPATSRDHREAACPRPIDEITGQSRLITVGKAVNHTGLPGLMGQDRAAERVSLDRHVDDRLSGRKCRQTVFDGGHRIAGALGNHIDAVEFDERFPVVGEVRRAIPESIIQGSRAIPLLGPPDAPGSDRTRWRPSAMPTMCTPGVRGPMNFIAPNLQLQINPPYGAPLCFAREFAWVHYVFLIVWSVLCHCRRRSRPSRYNRSARMATNIV